MQDWSEFRPLLTGGVSGHQRTMRLLIFIILLPFSQLCYAGGDFVSGKISDVLEIDEEYSIRFIQTETRPELKTGCRDITVIVNYAQVPWYSWLPFIKSSHHTKEQTVDAIKYLVDAKNSEKEVYLGYIGGGLIPADNVCTS